MRDPLMQIIIGLILGTSIGILAWRAGSLSLSGTWAAVGIGSLIFGSGGISWALPLILFFTTSSIWSRAFARRKAKFNEKFSKGSQRDWAQVIANGGLGAFMVIAQQLLPDQPWPWVAYIGGMAAVNADTWATELGVLSPYPPRLITNRRIVEPGTSGGISIPGSLAALSGSVLIGICAISLPPALFPKGYNITLLLAAISGGLAGSFFDSWLGATFQAIFHCPVCTKETERHPLHSCGNATTHVRGWLWLNNDAVNFAASLTGALTACVVWLILV